MNYRARVSVFAASGALLRTADGEKASYLVACGAGVLSIRDGFVSAIKLAVGQAVHGGRDVLRPGSFGIRRELIAGHVVFDHRDTHEGEIQRAA